MGSILPDYTAVGYRVYLAVQNKSFSKYLKWAKLAIIDWGVWSPPLTHLFTHNQSFVSLTLSKIISLDYPITN